MTTPKHPAVFTDAILDAVAVDLGARHLPSYTTVMDPFGGIGKVHHLAYVTTTVEIEEEWADHAWTLGESICTDSLGFMETTERRWDVVVTSPVYGNRMSDHHEAKDKCSRCKGTMIEVADEPCSKCKGSGLSPRRSYRHYLGRMPATGSSATLQWGDAYREFHQRAWAGVFRVLRPGGLFYLNVKDHIRKGERQMVSAWHAETCEALGFVRVNTLSVSTRGSRYGRNHRERVDFEYVYVFQKPEGEA